MKKATLFEKLKNNRVKCTACAHYCHIMPQRAGICGVRFNKEGELYLIVYGKASAVHVDPIEKKPLFHFLPGTEIFSIGTVGCNFGCDFCQNWDLSQASKMVQQKVKDPQAKMVKLGELVEYGQDLPPKKIVDYCLEKKIPSIAYTYNEPVIFFEYLYDTAKLAHAQGIKNVFVSNGYESKEALEKIHPYLDAINIDLKSFNEKFYQKTCKAHLGPVLENIKRVYEMKIWLEVTTLIIPDENDSDQELESIAKFLVGNSNKIPWHITAFHPDFKMEDKPATSPESLKRAYEIGKKAGLKYIYTGNVFDLEHQSTYCPKCGKLLIGRDWHTITEFNLASGKCPDCKIKIEGVWF